MNSAQSPMPTPVHDLEVKDPQIIFERVWSKLEEDLGKENLIFPKEIFWLNGSPGAGKGTNTGFIMKMRDLTAPPITVSQLLKSPEAKKRMDAGVLVGDREVTELVLRRLLDPEFQHGAIVDGFPRTKVQVECVKQLYAKLDQLHQEHLGQGRSAFPKCRFHIVVLFIDEGESVRRQLSRGRQAIHHNEKVRESGVGNIIEVRKTDLSEDAARGRYRTFKEITYHALRELQEVFHYHYIDAQGPIPEVQERIIEELHYQSSLELDESTYRRMGGLPIASTLGRHARQELVDRLDSYEENHTKIFSQVVYDIERYFMPIVKRHAISGMALINTENPLYHDDLAVEMLIDVFSERGFHAVVDTRKEAVPERVNLRTGEISLREKIIYRVRVNFGGADIRKGR